MGIEQGMLIGNWRLPITITTLSSPVIEGSHILYAKSWNNPGDI